MESINLAGVYGANNALIPKNGPKVAKAILDFSNAAEILVDGQQIVSQGHIEFLQGVYVDNGSNAVPLTLIMNTTKQRIIVPANTQGYYNILSPNNPKIIAQMAQLANRTVELLFYNVPIQAHTWTTS